MSVNGLPLNLFGDMVALQARNNRGVFEPVSFALWRQTCRRPGAVAIDVGAYTGIYTMGALSCNAQVYAYEPNPANYRRLRENLSDFEQYRTDLNHIVICGAAGAFDGRVTLYDTAGRPELTSAGKVRPDPAGSVRMSTIDALRLSRCDIIKVDVEGTELEVLKGAAATIAGFLPSLIIEANTQREADALDRHLSPYGYGSGIVADERNRLYVHPDR